MESTVSIQSAHSTLWDVIIIGGGVAGGFSGYLLSQSGLRVLILDKDKHPRFKVCGCCISPEGVSILQDAGLLKEIVSLTAPVSSFKLFSGKKATEIELQSGISIERSILDFSLLECAIREGASVLYDVKAESYAPFSEHAVVHANSKAGERILLKSKIVVGAFGLSGLSIAPKTQRSNSSTPSYIGVGALVSIKTFPDSQIVMAIGSNGYVGGVKLKDGTVDIGAALSAQLIKKHDSIDQAVQSIVLEAGAQRYLTLPSLQWKGTPKLTNRSTVAAERYFAVGDACGYLEPFTGEGMTWALKSALLAAPLIESGVGQWKGRLSKDWNLLYLNTIGRSQRTCGLMMNVLRFPTPIRNILFSALENRIVSRSISKLVSGSSLSWL